MDHSFKSVLKRIGRACVVVGIEEAVRAFTGSPYTIVLIPILQGIGKYLREVQGAKNVPI